MLRHKKAKLNKAKPVPMQMIRFENLQDIVKSFLFIFVTIVIGQMYLSDVLFGDSTLFEDPEEVELNAPPTRSHRQSKVDIDVSNLGQDATWQPVNGTEYKFMVYSAFYDSRTEDVVRIIGAIRTVEYDKVWCKFYYPEESVPSSVLASGYVEILPEHGDLGVWFIYFLPCEFFILTF